MQALKDSFAWDERTYGREYDLDRFNIVAVSDFNFGAMENKGLNIFNTRYVLADPETASDGDIDAVAAVVAHEYFHNWSGNRVTCRDWFQLSLKEGLTVFRDQGFSEDMGSAAVQRIDQVRTLRAAQFPEDAGPLAHPIRPDSYLEIANFYTATVYNKGAEVIRMMRTILGPEAYRKGTDLYFERHDGQAVTCEDFVRAMEDASGVDLRQFRLWYSQAGTPTVKARLEQGGGRATLHLSQTIAPTPGQPVKQPMAIPLKVALIGAESGREIVPERLVLLTEAEQSVELGVIDEPAYLSINRNFSAPVIVEAERRPGEIEALAVSDTDSFARYEAGQELMNRDLLAAIASGGAVDVHAIVAAVGATLRSQSLDPAFKADAIALPGESLLIEKLDKADPARVHAVREEVRRAIGTQLKDELSRNHQAASAADPASLSGEDKGLRRLRAATLGLLAAGDPELGASLAQRQYDEARTMTERQSALMVLAMLGTRRRHGGAGGFLRPLRGRSAGHRQVVRGAGVGFGRSDAGHGRAAAGASGLHLCQSQPLAGTRRQLRRYAERFPPRRRQGLRLVGRSDCCGGQAQSADRRALRRAARALAQDRGRPRRPDARRAAADPRRTRAEQRRVRTGEQKSGVRSRRPGEGRDLSRDGDRPPNRATPDCVRESAAASTASAIP